MTSTDYGRAADSLTATSTAIDAHIASFLTLMQIVTVRQRLLVEKLSDIGIHIEF